MVTLRVTLGDP